MQKSNLKQKFANIKQYYLQNKMETNKLLFDFFLEELLFKRKYPHLCLMPLFCHRQFLVIIQLLAFGCHFYSLCGTLSCCHYSWPETPFPTV